MNVDSARVDKGLWAIRLFKTRTAAAAACRAGHVSINGKRVKPSASVRRGDHVEARVGDWPRVVQVRELIATRVGASVAANCFVDHSEPRPAGELSDLHLGIRDRGAGRPTKRDRREMERLRGRTRR